MSEDGMYRAVASRDRRFDGAFFVAVTSTGIYCRPSCPATTPKRENVRFFRTAASAQGSGFRACRRCRPDAVPGSAEWNVRADLVGRALRLIGDGYIDRAGVGGLAERLGYSRRQLQRQLVAELGVGPLALARAQRAHTARILLQTTELPAAQIAFAAGFSSIRQFNDTIREVYADTPGGLRTARADRTIARLPSGEVRPAGLEGLSRSAGLPGPKGVSGTAGAPAPAPAVPLRLAYRGPYAARELFDFLARRALPGVEELVGPVGARSYRRTLRLPHGPGIVQVEERTGDGWLDCQLQLTDLRDLTTAGRRVRRLFDLDADPYAVTERLVADPGLKPLVERLPGLRVPGSVDASELAVRAVLGQQVSVTAARRLGAALVEAYGEPLAQPVGGLTGLTHLFPAPQTLAGTELDRIGMPAARRRTVRALCTALAEGRLRLDPGADRREAEQGLLSVPGIGPWTAGYVLMRGLGDPDVLLDTDAGIVAGARRAGVSLGDAGRWQPWRSYAMQHLWTLDGLRAEPGEGASRITPRQERTS